jgi:hypothetical protein
LTPSMLQRLLLKEWCGLLEARSRWAAKMRKCAMLVRFIE